MKAGICTKNITPPIGVNTPVGKTTGTHDPLFLKALVLDDGTNSVAIVCLDLSGGSPAFCDAMANCIRERTGIEHTLINFSHSHSAPGGSLPSDGATQEINRWVEKLNKLIPAAVGEAYTNRISVSVRVGRAPAQVGFNRRLPDEDGFVHMAVNEDGAVVPWVNVLQICAESGDTRTVLFEHAAHPVIVHGASSLCGTDYTGFAVERLNAELGDDVTAIFAQGCGGNINGYPLRGGWVKAKEAGSRLGDAVIEALCSTTEIKADSLNVQSTRVMLPAPLPSMKVWHETHKLLKRIAYERGTAGHELYLSMIGPLEVMKGMIERGEKPESRFDITTVMIGTEWCLITMPQEPFCEYELWVDENAPFDHTMVFGYTNGQMGYVATDQALARGEKGGYEAGSCPSIRANALRCETHAPFAVGIEGMIHGAIVSLWNRN